MVGFCRRFDESYLDASSKAKQGKIGKPIVFRSHGCEKLDTSPFFKQYLGSSGGIFIDTIIHDIDLSLMFLARKGAGPNWLLLWACPRLTQSLPRWAMPTTP